MRFAVQANSVSHGRMPTANTGTKYHHGASRLCLVGQEAGEVLVDEEEIEELRVALDTTTNHGAAMSRNSSEPFTRCSRRQSPQSRVSAQ